MLAVTFGMSRLEHLCIRYLEVIINLKNVLVNNFESKFCIDYVITVGSKYQTSLVFKLRKCV